MTQATPERPPHSCHEHHASHVSGVPPVITRAWQRVVTFGNATIGLAELLTGNLNTLSVAGDGLHNVGDVAGYYYQSENILSKKLTSEQRTRRRKIAHTIIAAGSLAVAAKAGIDLAGYTEGEPHRYAVYAAGASLLLNAYVWSKFRQGMRHKRALGYEGKTADEKDIIKHIWAVDMPSAVLAVGGVVAQKYNVGVEQSAAILSGLVGAWAFRPTKRNLEHHDCPLHGGVATTVHRHEHARAHGARLGAQVVPEQSFLARQRAKRQAQRQADCDARWQAWLEKCAVQNQPGKYYLAKWAQQQLALSTV